MDFSLHNVYNPFVVEFIEHRYLFLAIPAVWGAFWLYKREPEGASRNMRVGLAVIRAVLIYMALFLCLDPTQTKELERSENKVFLVLVDTSASMGISGSEYTADQPSQQRVKGFMDVSDDELKKLTRLDLAKSVLTKKQHKSFSPKHSGEVDMLTALAAKNTQVKVYGFANDLEVSEEEDDTPKEEVATALDKLNPKGDLTDLGGALRKALNQNTGSRVQGVLVLTDGKDNVGERVNTVLRRQFGPHKIPTVFVPIGSTVPQPNLLVSEVKHPAFIMKGENPQTIRAEVHVKNYQNSPKLRVSLVKNGPGSEDAVIDTIDIDPARDMPERVRMSGEDDFLVFQVSLKDKKPTQEGEFQYTVKVEDASSKVIPELVVDDNSKTKNIPIRKDRVKVLLLADRPNWDFMKLYRFLWRNSDEDSGVFKYTAIAKEASARWRAEGEPYIPREPKENYRITLKDIPRDLDSFKEKYDVVLIQDIPLEFLEYMNVGQGPSMADLLYRFATEHAGGLIFQAGPQGNINFYKTHTHHRDKDGNEVEGGLADLLPITIKDGTERGQVVDEGLKIAPTRLGLNHQLMFIGRNQTKSAELWRSMSKNRWYYSPEDVPSNCTILARAQGVPWKRDLDMGKKVNEEVPLLVVNESAGKGRSLFVGVDDTYLWVFRKHNDVLFNNFWSHVFQWMAAKKLSGFTGNATITMPNQEPRLGDRAALRVEFNSDEVTPKAESINVVWEYPSGKENLTLRRHPGNRRLYTANHQMTHKGKNIFTFEDEGAKGAYPSVERVVMDRSEELDDPIVSPEEFGTYAGVNTQLNKVYQVDETKAVPGFFRGQSQQLGKQTIQRTLITPRNAFSFFLPFMLLITIEWILRKKYRML